MNPGVIEINVVRSLDEEVLRLGAADVGVGGLGGIVHATIDGNTPVWPTKLSLVRGVPSDRATTRGYSVCERSVSEASFSCLDAGTHVAAGSAVVMLIGFFQLSHMQYSTMQLSSPLPPIEQVGKMACVTGSSIRYTVPRLV